MRRTSAARNASLVTAAVLLVLISRSEIRKALLAGPPWLPLLAALVWIGAFLAGRLGGRRRPRE